MQRVVFLDYDGVVNRKMWALVEDKWVCRFGYPEDATVNDTQAVQWVSEFCEKYGYDIVVTSTWRKYPEWEQCLRNAGLREGIKILGATPLPAKARAEEIADYLSAHLEIEQYLIFDDDLSLLENHADDEFGVLCGICPHSDHLVLCDSEHGFGESEYNLAVALHVSATYRKKQDMSRLEVKNENFNDLKKAAIETLYATGELTVPFLQRAFRLGNGNSWDIIDYLVDEGVVFGVKKNGQVKYLPAIEYEKAKAKLHEK